MAFLAAAAAVAIAPLAPVAPVASVAPVAIPIAPVAATLRIQVPIVGGIDVGDVQEAVAADAEIHERRLDARFDVDDAALVNVADVTLLAGAFDVQFFEASVFDDRDPAFLGLQDIDQHFFFHESEFLN